MKFLEAKRDSGAPENKMLRGSREDQGGGDRNTGHRVRDNIPNVRPDVKELADELGVELSSITGTGRNGSITMGDVRKAAADREERNNNESSGL